MMVRRIALAIGVVALMVGIAGLLSPVSISPGLTSVPCGTAVAPDLQSARQQAPADTQTSPQELPYDSEWVGDVDYGQLCDKEIADRRAWTITVTVVGLLGLLTAAALGIRARRTDGAKTG